MKFIKMMCLIAVVSIFSQSVLAMENLNSQIVTYDENVNKNLFLKYFVNGFFKEFFREKLSKSFNVEYVNFHIKSIEEVINKIDNEKLVFLYENKEAFFYDFKQGYANDKCVTVIGIIELIKSLNSLSLDDIKFIKSYSMFENIEGDEYEIINRDDQLVKDVNGLKILTTYFDRAVLLNNNFKDMIMIHIKKNEELLIDTISKRSAISMRYRDRQDKCDKIILEILSMPYMPKFDFSRCDNKALQNLIADFLFKAINGNDDTIFKLLFERGFSINFMVSDMSLLGFCKHHSQHLNEKGKLIKLLEELNAEDVGCIIL